MELTQPLPFEQGGLMENRANDDQAWSPEKNEKKKKTAIYAN